MSFKHGTLGSRPPVRRPFGRSPPFKRLSPPAAAAPTRRPTMRASERAGEGGTSTIIHPRSIHPFVPSSFISVRKNSARRRNHTRFRGRAPRPPILPLGDPCNLMMVFSKSGSGSVFIPLRGFSCRKIPITPFFATLYREEGRDEGVEKWDHKRRTPPRRPRPSRTSNSR